MPPAARRARGYLIDQFFWSGANARTDRYGGATLAERSRLASEVMAAAGMKSFSPAAMSELH